EISVLRGRAIGDVDRRGGPGAAVVNETLARRLWPGSDALGRLVRLDEGYSVRVIGGAHDAKYDGATADPRRVLQLSLGQRPQLALTGVAVGAVLALPMASVLGALIFGVQIADLATFAGTCALLLAVAMVASFLPARRAARLDPIVALRTE